MRAQRDPDFGRQEASRAAAFAEGLRWLADVTCKPEQQWEDVERTPEMQEIADRARALDESEVVKQRAWDAECVSRAGEFAARYWHPEDLLLSLDDVRQELKRRGLTPDS
jgi:hypothetical protein